ncbi:bifunctional [glutamine synthetase] adenylyltransferase/[glutamine synthetase]-adenylyl-L-tyrosine phosphorylase [Trebonia kvetii]|uniref:Bifunctional glutamine synthetase adenylyltransferase/adenylyl-removing enzyme n=1 Tax=Trebonia kvetii TaxID=2480626 RepID=A0A6P2BPF7_9ACTN|nr:bifunctional [glutamine synthetase] adenylyltransferase/[glutamine synthetase]-adenylyl-L-tyrosine phosphorylase [Trebonia kvetii]TVZ00902.1 bifunctional [glutamine synthetase] adenylyltransferase/[glutamine synthetase]-adenylyl-L-tyrosine phosphorylase [Trebonia kvetii]
MGFADVPRAERDLAALGIGGEVQPVLVALAQAADPDLALSGLAQIASRYEGLIAALTNDPSFRARLIAVLGVSKFLADHLTRHPEDSALLRGPEAARRPDAKAIRAEFLRAVGAGPDDTEPVASDPSGAPAALAAAYHRRILHLTARDMTDVATVDEVAEELADLADAVLESALAIARAELPADAAPVRLAVVAMGKCGARELNYSSDIDVIFVAEPVPRPDGSPANEEAALKTATRLATGLIKACDQVTPEGTLFPVDPNLRPEGRQGTLVRTLASHLAYYDRWAKTWEFQALLKARPAAGDLTLGRRYADAVAPLVWQASARENFVEDVQSMRRRVLNTLPKNMAGRELKLGPGGLRDIEFAVQLLQLVHGHTDERLRVPATLPALAALADNGYVGRADAEELATAYRFLRQTEHLLQVYQLRRTHTLPTDAAVLRRLGRALGTGVRPMIPNVRVAPPDGHAPVAPKVPPGGARQAAPARADLAKPPEEAFNEAWSKTAQRVRRLHEKLFYRPLLDAVAKLPTEAARLTPEAAMARLEALGYRDPAGALRHIEALTSGLRRRAAIQRTLLPVLLGWFADAAEPDAGLLAFRQVSEALGETPWFLRLLRDETKAAERMAAVLASSRYATGLLLRAPDAVALFADDAELVPKPLDALRAEMLAAARRHAGDAEQVAVAVRSLRRRELFRVAVADVLGLIDLSETGEALTAITTASLDAVLTATIAKIETEQRGPLPVRFAVIAMGRYGGHESGFGSDADVIFVFDPLPFEDAAGERRASEAAQAVGAELRRLLQIPAPDPPLLVDADLRPEGKQGPLVRSLGACEAYYARRAAVWEWQALLRAEFAAGDTELGAKFIAVADKYRYRSGGLTEAAAREIRRIKARVEAERIPRGTDRALHLKLGPGGLSDVEWTVQLLQLQHGHAVPGLRTTRTLAALDAALDAGLVTESDATALSEAWRFAARIRDAIMLVRGRPGDTLPARQDELTAVARLLGYKPAASNGSAPHVDTSNGPSSWSDTPAAALEEEYRRTARRARKVMDRLFYG